MAERSTPSTVVFEGNDFDYCKVGLTPETTNLKVNSLPIFAILEFKVIPRAVICRVMEILLMHRYEYEFKLSI